MRGAEQFQPYLCRPVGCPGVCADVPKACPSLAERSKSASGGERLRPAQRDGHGGAPQPRLALPCLLPRIPARIPAPPGLLQVFVRVLLASSCFGGCRGLGVLWELSRPRGVFGAVAVTLVSSLLCHPKSCSCCRGCPLSSWGQGPAGTAPL